MANIIGKVVIGTVKILGDIVLRLIIGFGTCLFGVIGGIVGLVYVLPLILKLLGC